MQTDRGFNNGIVQFMPDPDGLLAGLPLSMVSASLFAAPIAGAAPPCPDVEVIVRARRTFEPPGVGGTGRAFVDALTRQLGDKSVECTR